MAQNGMMSGWVAALCLVTLGHSTAAQNAGTDKKSEPRFIPSRAFQLKDLKVADLKVGSKVIHAWLMDTPAKQEEGMMVLEERDVKPNQGMLFVFDKERPQSFWMHNTVLALDIIYISKSGVVRNIQKGKPFDETSLPSRGPALYVLELKQGQAAKFGIHDGTKIKIPASVKARY